jgi:hypothetical protein
VGFQNIGGFTLDNSTFKDYLLREGINTFQLDILGMAETNMDWQLVEEDKKLYNRTRGWWESMHFSYTYNITGPLILRQQWGGTALFSINKAAHRVVEKGMDESKLGRWFWTKYRGRNNYTLVIFVAYCPNPPTGPFSVYAQQRSFFTLQQDERCPRVAFAEDFSLALQKTIDSGALVLAMMDGNQDMRNSRLATKLKEINMREILLSRHGTHGPSTYRRNESRTPIDGIWVSPGLDIKAGGYLDYDQFLLNADHRCLWVDISFIQAFSHNMPAIAKPKMCRLNCRNPNIVKNYVNGYEKLASRNRLSEKVLALLSKASYPLSHTLQLEYERTDYIRCQITAAAEKKM